MRMKDIMAVKMGKWLFLDLWTSRRKKVWSEPKRGITPDTHRAAHGPSC